MDFRSCVSIPTSSFTTVSLRPAVLRGYYERARRQRPTALAWRSVMRSGSGWTSAPPHAARHGDGVDGAEDHERYQHDDVHGADAAIQDVDREPASGQRDGEAQQGRRDGPEQPTRALRSEVEGEAEPEEAVSGADDTKVRRAGLDDVPVAR